MFVCDYDQADEERMVRIRKTVDQEWMDQLTKQGVIGKLEYGLRRISKHEGHASTTQTSRHRDTMYYPEGVTDPNYCVLKFVAASGRCYVNFYSESFENH